MWCVPRATQRAAQRRGLGPERDRLHGRVDPSPAGRGDGTEAHRDPAVNGRASGPRPASPASVSAVSWRSRAPHDDNAQRSGAGWVPSEIDCTAGWIRRRPVVEMAPRLFAIRWSTDERVGPDPRRQPACPWSPGAASPGRAAGRGEDEVRGRSGPGPASPASVLRGGRGRAKGVQGATRWRPRTGCEMSGRGCEMCRADPPV